MKRTMTTERRLIVALCFVAVVALVSASEPTTDEDWDDSVVALINYPDCFQRISSKDNTRLTSLR